MPDKRDQKTALAPMIAPGVGGTHNESTGDIRVALMASSGRPRLPRALEQTLSHERMHSALEPFSRERDFLSTRPPDSNSLKDVLAAELARPERDSGVHPQIIQTLAAINPFASTRSSEELQHRLMTGLLESYHGDPRFSEKAFGALQIPTPSREQIRSLGDIRNEMELAKQRRAKPRPIPAMDASALDANSLPRVGRRALAEMRR